MLLTAPVVDGEVVPVVVSVAVTPVATGRDVVADSAALALQVAQALQLPLLDREAEDALRP